MEREDSGAFWEKGKRSEQGRLMTQVVRTFFFKASFGIFGTTTKFSFQKALDPIALIF